MQDCGGPCTPSAVRRGLNDSPRPHLTHDRWECLCPFSSFPGGATGEGQLGEGLHFAGLRAAPLLRLWAQLCQAGNPPHASF